MTDANKECPEFPFFGASYPDATCNNGYLWDLDSCDEPGGPLFSGGDYPCPFCNFEKHVERSAENLWNESEQMTPLRARTLAADGLNAFRKRHGFHTAPYTPHDGEFS